MGTHTGTDPMTERVSAHLVLWDGECSFCGRIVRWAERRNPGVLHFVPYQQAPESIMTDALRAACEKSVQVITADGRLLHGARASLFVLDAVGWSRTASVLRVPPLVWFAELGYRVAARNRRRISRLFPR